MVPQHSDLSRSDSPTSSGLPMFGSQLVDKNSSTPYSDATQVFAHFLFPPTLILFKQLISTSALYFQFLITNYCPLMVAPATLTYRFIPDLLGILL